MGHCQPGMKSPEEGGKPPPGVGVEDTTFAGKVLLLCAAVCQCVSGEEQIAPGMYSPKRNPSNRVAARATAKKKGRRRSSVSESSASDSPAAPYNLRQRVRRYRAMSACEYVENYLSGEVQQDVEFEDASQKEIFPFESLPTDCKLKILSFLGATERGRAALVCREWSHLVRTPGLWHTLDFTELPTCTVKATGHDCTRVCYNKYKARMKKFFHFMQTIRPVVKQLRFAFDIANYEDSWLDLLNGFMRAARCKDLQFAHLNWKETPAKPFAMDHMTWSTNDYSEFMHKFRHRQRKFVNFFEQFTLQTPNITRMILPFDWSNRSLDNLRNLPELHSVVLEKYFVFQPLSQSALDRLFVCVPKLKHLLLEVWTPSGQGLQLYRVQSPILEYLDITQCRGFYLREVALPSLKVFKVTRHPWNGPLTCRESLHIPCLYHILREGATNLQQLNEHVLRPGWQDASNPDLETVLKSVCSCRQHKSGWAM